MNTFYLSKIKNRCGLLMLFFFAASTSWAQLTINVAFNASCKDDGSVSAFVTGGTAPYTYKWSSQGFGKFRGPFKNEQTITGLPAGIRMYVIATDANGKSISGFVQIPANTQMNIIVGNAHCPANDGSISLKTTGGVAPFSYLWSNNATTQSLSNIAAGDYFVTLTDGNGCFQYPDSLIRVEATSQVKVTTNVTPVKCANDGSASANAFGGLAPYTYYWNTTPPQNTPSISGLSEGAYSVTAVDAQGCIGLASTYVYNYSSITATPQTTPEFCSNKDGSISLTPSGGQAPYTFKWENGQNGNPLSNLSGNIVYNCTITDSKGCIGGVSFYVGKTSPIKLSFTTVDEHCNNDGAVTALPSSGTAPYTFTWNNYPAVTGPTLDKLPAGYYQVTVVDNQGCESVSGAQIAFKSTIKITATVLPENCIQKDGSISLALTGGLAPYSFHWDNGAVTQNLSGLASGDYSVYVSDANGCHTPFKAPPVPNKSPIVLTTTYVQSACHDGSITANAASGTAPYSYVWYKDWNNTQIQTTQKATGLDPGDYSVKVKDSQGCYAVAKRYLPPSSILAVEMENTLEHCHDGNGTATVTKVAGGTPPYTYRWSTGSVAPSISGLKYGWYTVIVTDSKTCDKTKEVFIDHTRPISLSMSATAPTCGNADGTATVVASGGTPPYTYSWGNGQKGATAINLYEDWYGVYVKDAQNCDASNDIPVREPSICNIGIEGKVINDLDGNCQDDAGELGLPAVLVGNSNGHYTFTNGSGSYYFAGKANKTYTIKESVPKYFSQLCPSAPGVILVTPAPGTVSKENNFYVKAKADTNDLAVAIWNPKGALRPGFNHKYDVFFGNAGNSYMTGEVSFVHDTAVDFRNSYPLPDSYDPTTRTATYSFKNLPPHYGNKISIYVRAHKNVPLGTNVCYTASITPIVNDNKPLNNQSQYCQEVEGSYDPNYVEVSPKGTGVDGTISKADSILSYTIHFQNTGTDTAFTVAVIDTLDPNLNVISITKGASSHNCSIDIKPGNILTATFDNILLPDSNRDEENSHGFINLTLHIKPNLTEGTQIKASANIYFDYNVPVRTNTVVNTIEKITGIRSMRNGSPELSVYPNPMNQSATFKILNYNASNNYSFSLLDITGREVKRMDRMSSETFILKKDGLVEAMYFYKLESNKEVIATGKIIVQ